MPRVTKKPEVWRDLESITDYLGQQREDLPFRFIDAVEATFEKLSHDPDRGFLCTFENPELSGLRVVMIQGFEKYLVFYRGDESGVDIVRVLYGGRDLGSLFGSAD